MEPELKDIIDKCWNDGSDLDIASRLNICSKNLVRWGSNLNNVFQKKKKLAKTRLIIYKLGLVPKLPFFSKKQENFMLLLFFRRRPFGSNVTRLIGSVRGIPIPNFSMHRLQCGVSRIK